MLRLLLVLVAVCPKIFAEDTDEPFQQGLAAYQRRDFAGAAERFRAAIERGPVTARLLHNLALAHYQANERALALAYWRKALVLDPTYPAALTGRELLENHAHMRPFEKDGLDLYLRHAFERASAFVISWALAVVIAIFAWVTLRYWGERRRARDEDRPGPGFPALVAGLGALLVITTTLFAIKLSYLWSRRATVVADQAAAKSLPNEESASLFTLHSGGEVLVRRDGDGWTQVVTSDGGTGWVKNSDLVVTSEM